MLTGFSGQASARAAQGRQATTAAVPSAASTGSSARTPCLFMLVSVRLLLQGIGARPACRCGTRRENREGDSGNRELEMALHQPGSAVGIARAHGGEDFPVLFT